MKKKNNKGKKALTAVGAVVAAGLTPGFIAASAAGSSIQSPSAGTTAAEVVAIDGQAYSFDELYAMQNPDSVDMDAIVTRISTMYGVRPINNINKNDTKDDKNIIYRSVEQMPQFPGGEAALMKYLQSHILYPPMAAENEAQGRVVVRFIVDETGKVSDATVIHSVDEYLDKEVVRVCKSLPKFTPGRHNGQAVSVWYTLPVTFELKDAKKATAADAVAIDGKTYSFDELYAKQHPDSVNMDGILPEVLIQGMMPRSTRYSSLWNGYSVIDGDTVYRNVERAAIFPGGDGILIKYIKSNFQYPANAIKNHVQGCVALEFVVTKTGKVGFARADRSVDKELSDEAVRVIKTLPYFFKPALKNGHAVSSWYSLRVTFTLPEE